MNTPTPETDAKTELHPSWPAEACSFARKLERERNEARKDAKEGWTTMARRMDRRDADEAERDQLRKVADSQNKILTRMLSTYGYPRWGNEDIEVRETMSFYNNLLHVKK